ncbi:hypothetical protein F4776DRAFT_344561 [Hypoxylon sp. NC0597]|nr:hypothetical protein F4776DRAFT_344561 [Hypoxylon sp. NC0597]
MAVTELAWLTAALGVLTNEAKEAINQALIVQDEWTALNTPDLPKDRDGRGVALFQQVEDPAIWLLTAHWDSVEQHGVWLESPENKKVFSGLGDYYELEKTYLCHLENIWLFNSSGVPGEISLLESPVISVGRITILAEKRQEFEKQWEEVKGLLEDFAKPYVVKLAWRIEMTEPSLEEFVLTCGWPSVERHKEWAKDPNFEKYASALLPFAQSQDIKHYQRVL